MDIIRNIKNRLATEIFYAKRDRRAFQGDVWQKKYREYRGPDVSAFITPHWKSVCEKLSLNSFKPDFLSYKFIRNTMTFNDPKMLSYHLKKIDQAFGARAKDVVRENPVGKPSIVSMRYWTSHSTIMHVNHVLEFKEQTGIDLWNAKNIVEWGGGYGSLARILKSESMTYTIIDLPLFSFTQGMFLSSIPRFKDKVNMITEPGQKLKIGSINLIPLNPSILRSVDFGIVDAFVSTWALSESLKASQDLVQELDYFGAKSILIGHQKKGDTMPFAESINLTGYDIIYHKPPALFSDDDRYLFAKRTT